jgi:hypothetical protein
LEQKQKEAEKAIKAAREKTSAEVLAITKKT